MEELKTLTLATAERDILTAVAGRRLTKLRDAFEGVRELDADTIDKVVLQLVFPMKTIYKGRLHETLEKSVKIGLTHKSAELTTAIAESNRLRSIFFESNEDCLTECQKKDVERIRSNFAGLSINDYPELVIQLVDNRSKALAEEYSKILLGQLKRVFSETTASATIPAPSTHPSNETGKSQAATGSNKS